MHTLTGVEPGGRDPKYPLGVAMVMTAGVCLSFGGLIVRHIEAADGWQILFYRSIAFAATVLAFLLVRYRGRVVRPFAKIGWNGVLAALCLAAGSASYVFALLLTTVANAVFIVSASPFFAAILGWLVLGERVHGTTWLAIAAAIAGIGLMFIDGLTAGRWLGNLVALTAPVSFAVMIVIMRRTKSVDMMPATCLAGVIMAGVGLLMVDSLAIPERDLALALTMGFGQLGIAVILITLGARHVPAAEVALLSLTEAAFAPVWVWLVVDEVPNALALAGGTIVLTAVVAQALGGVRRKGVPRSSLEKGSAVE
jgi:drug/metabolite transporter (DMT)-like permease